MLKVTVLLVTILLFLMAASFAQDYQLVGFTQEEVNGEATILVLHSLCGANFKGSRWCESEDIVRNGSIAIVETPESAQAMSSI